MAKHKKIKSSAPGGKQAKKPLNYRRALALSGLAILSVFVYFGLLELSEYIGYYLPVIETFTVLIAMVVCAIFIVNAGLSDTPPTTEELPDGWSEEKKEKFIGSFPKRKAAVKKLSFSLIILIVPVFMDIVLLWLDAFIK